MVFDAINPDESNVGAEFTAWTLTEYIDKYWQFDAEASNEGSDRIPFIEQGWIDVKYKDQIIFRGYLESIDPSENKTQRLTYFDLRRSLDEVYCQIMEYPAGTTLNQMLSSSVPIAGVKPGLLWLLNSGVPQGDFVLYSGEIYKLEGAGSSNPRCGTGRIFQESTELTLGSGAATLTRGKYYRTSTDLYVRCTDGRDPKYWLMSIENFKDSRIRLGTIENGSYSFTVPYRIESKKCFRDLIEPLITALGLEMYLEHRLPESGEVLGVSYLSASSTYGKGSETEPTAFFGESSMPGGAMLVQEATTGGGSYNCILGAGPGSGYSQVVAARANYAKLGHWKETVYSTSLLGELLENSLDKLWDDQEDGRCWEVKDEMDLTRMPGDWVEITPYKSQAITKRIMKAVHTSEGKTSLEINQRRLEPEDEMRARSQVVNDLMGYISNQVTSWSSSFGPENIDDATSPYESWGGEAVFTVNIPADSIDEEFPYKFFLKFDIVPYESDTDSVDTAAHDNGGVTGSHSGYGGGTSAKTQSAHSVNSFSGNTTNSSVSVENYVSSAGSHSHSVGLGSTTSHTGTTSGHYHTYSYATGASCYSAGDHTHPRSAIGVPDFMHVHIISAHSTNAAEAQNHGWGTDGGSGGSAQSRAVFTEPQQAAISYVWKKLFDTGNSAHLLDVSVKVNDVHVDGSPFQSLYINDGEEVDVSSLVETGDNKIEFSIKDHSNPSTPVRCAVRGSLNAQYYIYPFAQ
jgi:hypothetical protein